MKEEEKPRNLKEEGLRLFCNETIVRRYLAIGEEATKRKKDIGAAATDLGLSYVYMVAMGLTEEIAMIISGEKDEELKEALPVQEELPSPTEELVRRYLRIKREVVRTQKGSEWLSQNLGHTYVAMGEIGLCDGIIRIISGEDEKPKELPKTPEKLSGLTPGRVVNLVYKELAGSGRILKEFSTIFPIVRDEDWHRIDECYLGGKGVVVETPNSKIIALLRGSSTGDRFLTSIAGGLVYAELREGDPMTGKKGLNSILWRAFTRKNMGLIIAEGTLFLDGEEIPRKYTVEFKESEKYFRGPRRFGDTIIVAEEGQKIPSYLRPVTIISSYKEEVVPYLVGEIKERLGIGEPPQLASPQVEENVLK